MDIGWLLDQMHPLRPGFWLLLSGGAGVALSLLARHRLSPVQRFWAGLALWVAIPYLGLLLGALSPRLMGLSQIDPVASIGLGMALIFVVWVLIALVRATLHAEEAHGETESGVSLSVSTLVVYAGAREFHWAFLRGAAWEMLLAHPAGMELPAYWSVWIAAALALPGIVLPSRDPAQGLIGGVLLITTTILFFYTRNFWLCWLLHASGGWLLGQGVPGPQDRLSQAR